MGTDYFHLLISLSPFYGLLGGLVLFGLGLQFRNADTQRIGLGFLVATAIMAIPVYLSQRAWLAEQGISGEGASLCLAGLIATEVTGLFALTGLFVSCREEEPLPPLLRVFIPSVAMVALGLVIGVGMNAPGAIPQLVGMIHPH